MMMREISWAGKAGTRQMSGPFPELLLCAVAAIAKAFYDNVDPPGVIALPRLDRGIERQSNTHGWR